MLGGIIRFITDTGYGGSIGLRFDGSVHHYSDCDVFSGNLRNGVTDRVYIVIGEHAAHEFIADGDRSLSLAKFY